MYRSEFPAMLHAYMRNQSYRKGQAAYNMMADIFPVEVNALAGSDADPFYNDNKIEAFLDALGITD